MIDFNNMLTISEDGQTKMTHQVDGRIETIVRWLLHQREAIAKIGNGQLTFDLAGTQVDASIRQTIKRTDHLSD